MLSKILPCLLLGVGATAITGADMNLSAMVSLSAGLMGGAAGNYFHQVSEDVQARLVASIFGRTSVVDRNHHILHALRLAHCTAISAVLDHFLKTHENERDGSRRSDGERFGKELRRYLQDISEVDLDPSATPSQLEFAVFDRLPEIFDKALAARSNDLPSVGITSLSSARREIETAVLEELALQTGTTLPELPSRFVAEFLSNDPNGWFSYFVRDGVDRLKKNESFKTIWTAEKIAQIQSVGRQTAVRIIDMQADVAKLLEYAEREAKSQRIAEAFINEMADRISADRSLDFDGKMTAVRQAIAIYASEIKGTRRVSDNEVVAEAVRRALQMAKEGRSQVARAILRKSASDLREAEAEHKARLEADLRALYRQEFEIAASVYDGENAAAALLALADDLAALINVDFVDEISRQLDDLHAKGLAEGSNIKLIAEIILRRTLMLDRSEQFLSPKFVLDTAYVLAELGEREASHDKYEVAIELCVGLLNEIDEKMNTDFAKLVTSCLIKAKTGLGIRLGEVKHLEDAVEFSRDALGKFGKSGEAHADKQFLNLCAVAHLGLGTHTRDPSLLREAISILDEIPDVVGCFEESGLKGSIENTAGYAYYQLGIITENADCFHKAIDRFVESLRHRTRIRSPIDWAATQENIGNVRSHLGDHHEDPAFLIQGLQAYEEALKERRRDRLPFHWAMTQLNIAISLTSLARMQRSNAKAKMAVEAAGKALSVLSKDKTPVDWGTAQQTLGEALSLIGERLNDFDTLRRAVDAFEAALQVRTREGDILTWGRSQHQLGIARYRLGKLSGQASQYQLALESLRLADSAVEARQLRRWSNAIKEHIAWTLGALAKTTNSDDLQKQSTAAFADLIAGIFKPGNDEKSSA